MRFQIDSGSFRQLHTRRAKKFLLAGLVVLWGGVNSPVAIAALSCSVATSCTSPAVVAFRLSSTTNAHAELPSQSNYTQLVCCTGVTGLANTCSGNNITVAKLAATTNAHVQMSDQSGYAQLACLSAPSNVTFSLANNVGSTPSDWYDSSWGYRKSVTIDNTKVSGSSDLTNFPVLISRIDSSLKSTGNGGNVGKTDGTDIVFTSSDGLTKLDHEIEYYSPTTGEIVAWVRIPTLATAADTVIYMYYGNAAASDQQNVTGVWNSNYQAVFHLSENPTASAPQFKDSKAGSNTGTSNGSQVSGDQLSGKIDGALNLDGTNDYVGITDNAKYDVNPANKYTWSFWIKPDDFEEWNTVWAQAVGSSNSSYNLTIFAHTHTSDGTWGTVTAGIGCGFVNTSANQNTITSNNNVLTAGTFAFVQCVYDGTQSIANRFKVYVNGVDQTNGNLNAGGGPGTMSADFIDIGWSTWSGEQEDGVVDEMRYLSTNLSSDWIATEYNNQSATSTFYSVGTEETSSGAAATCTGYDTTVFSVSSTTNAHAGDGSAYGSKVCASAAVDSSQTLTFVLSANTVRFGTLSAASARYASSTAAGDTTETVAHTLEAATSAASGYIISVQGTTLTSGSNTITAIGGTNTSSSVGTEQFGMRATASGGSGAVSVPYAAGGFAYAATALISDEVASSTAASATTTYSVRYIANISSLTESGPYSTALTYTVTANF